MSRATTETTVPDWRAHGRELLALGRWRQAYDVFVVALAEAADMAAGADAAEGMATAAWWLEDGTETNALHGPNGPWGTTCRPSPSGRRAVRNASIVPTWSGRYATMSVCAT